MQGSGATGGSLEERISHVLEELRVVLPGTQALLGFQFVAVFSNGFNGLAQWQKDLHFASLLFVTLSGLLLMTPAAYHRIVNDGGDTEAMHSFATRSLMLAMAALGFGVSLDLVVVAEVILDSVVAAAVTALIAVSLFAVAWFLLPIALRAKQIPAIHPVQASNVGPSRREASSTRGARSR